MDKTRERMSPKKVITVSDILTKDSVHSVLADVLEKKDTITEIICICTDKDGIDYLSSSIPLSRAVYLLEVIKNTLLTKEWVRDAG